MINLKKLALCIAMTTALYSGAADAPHMQPEKDQTENQSWLKRGYTWCKKNPRQTVAGVILMTIAAGKALGHFFIRINPTIIPKLPKKPSYFQARTRCLFQGRNTTYSRFNLSGVDSDGGYHEMRYNPNPGSKFDTIYGIVRPL